MAARDLIIDPATLDLSNVIADAEGIRKYNPQRFEMEQLTAIVYEDTVNNVCAGYKDITYDEFWVRGHMPNMPLMPGVVMLEAAAQMCSYFSQKHDLLGAAMIGFGGLEDVRFRDPVIPGDRLVLACEMTKLRRGRIVVTKFQGFVKNALAVEGVLKGIPIPIEVVNSQLANAAEARKQNGT
ncbi:MAG: beta-hydroxyacyl-ACP dehydratase [Planctomycetales bacterium]|nr:beta-hydroxyacyl-ACP dehydratase [Planctomycetales bacterium]